LGPEGGDPLADLGDLPLTLALQGQRPPAQHRALDRPLGKTLRGRERDRRLGVRMHGRHAPATLRDEGRETPRKRQTEGMRQLARQRQGLAGAGQGLRREPQ
jgi:hypothetical protein